MQLAYRPATDFEPAAVAAPFGPASTPVTGNPFLERWAVDAALRNLARPGERFHLLSAGPGDHQPVLPLTRIYESPFGLGSIWSVWDHIHCLDTTPGEADDFGPLLAALFDFLRAHRVRMLRWTSLPADTAFYGLLLDWLAESGLEVHVTKSVERPVLLADACPTRVGPDTILDGKRLRELRRTRRRLEERGRVEFKVVDGPHDARHWIPHFLDIEASGWKGEAGTALACRRNERAFFEQMTCHAAAEGNVLVYSLELDGAPVAMSVNYRAGGKVWCFKTAFRGELARYSPGALLEYESTLAALADPTLAWLDACTTDASGLMGELWRDRRPVVDLMISTRRSSNRLVRGTAIGWRGWLALKRWTRERSAKTGAKRGKR